jgi:hypothetical protein
MKAFFEKTMQSVQEEMQFIDMEMQIYGRL